MWPTCCGILNCCPSDTPCQEGSLPELNLAFNRPGCFATVFEGGNWTGRAASLAPGSFNGSVLAAKHGLNVIGSLRVVGGQYCFASLYQQGALTGRAVTFFAGAYIGEELLARGVDAGGAGSITVGEADGRWYGSAADTSCDNACEAHGLVCTEDGLAAHNGDADTPEAVLALIAQVDEPTAGLDCRHTAPETLHAPAWSAEACLPSRPGRPWFRFDCAARPQPPGQGLRRLCYCHAAASTSTTTAPPAPPGGGSAAASTSSTTAPPCEDTWSDASNFSCAHYAAFGWCNATSPGNPFEGIGWPGCARPGGCPVVPAFVDWDMDGDPDLVVAGPPVLVNGRPQPPLRYFERQDGGRLEERVGRGNPFRHLDVSILDEETAPAIAFADWDGDGDPDLVVGDAALGLRYFERLALDRLEERLGEGSPFRDLRVPNLTTAALADWDGDGDLDVIASGPFEGTSYFEHLAGGILVARDGPDNPFSFIGGGRPVLADWEGDGRLSMILGSASALQYYVQSTEDLFVARSEGGNPFRGIWVPNASASIPVFADWDGDGDLDCIMARELGVVYYERVAVDRFEERVEEGNPFLNITTTSDCLRLAVADWDGDTDLDLVVGVPGGTRLRFFERTAAGLEERGGEENPLAGVPVAGNALLACLDWDADGDVDLILMNPCVYTADPNSSACVGPSMLYYERISADRLEPRTGTSNPFDGIAFLSFAAFGDIDEDGDVDVLANLQGSLLWYERVSREAVQLRRAGSPFRGLSGHFDAGGAMSPVPPVLVDWDGDGDLDLALADGAGGLQYYARGFCAQSTSCDSRGTCNAATGRCACLPGYSPPHCTSCSREYYTSLRTYPPQCEGCAGNGSMVCANRGTCFDDVLSRADTSLSATEALLAVGTGSCRCSETAFSGLDDQGRTTCAEGMCWEGTEEVAPADGGPDVCGACPPGRYAGGEGAACASCSAGHFAAAGQGACSACPEGQFAPPAQAACRPCWGGRLPSPDRGSCGGCAPGRAAAGASAACEECAGGRHAAGGSALCSPCPGGRSPSAGRDTCELCAAGSFAAPGSSNCSACPAGAVAPAGSEVCAPCADGEAPVAEKDGCSTCPGGTFAAVGSAACSACPAGTYAPNGSTFCSFCVGGQAPVAERDACEACDGGTFAAAGSARCSACAAGMYAVSGSAFCSFCAGGHVPSAAADCCEACAPGRFASANSATCSACPAGRFSKRGSAACSLCGEGQVAVQQSTLCQACPGGRAPNWDKTACQVCGAGMYAVPGSEACDPCDYGSVATPGSTRCTVCDAGAVPAGGTNCSACPVGRFAAARSSWCSPCPAGRAASAAGAGSCGACREGHFAAAPGQAECSSCGAGSVPAPDRSSCALCGPGTFAASGNGTCTACPAGTYAASGSALCAACAGGRAPAVGGESCQACAGGMFAAAGSANCSTCPLGTYAGASSANCSLCLGGEVPNAQQGACEACAGGMFAAAGSANCSSCPLGTYSEVGSMACSLCVGGTIPSASQAGCEACAGGAFAVPGSWNCSTCSAGTYAARGSELCSSCLGGQVPTASKDACEACAGGAFAEAGSAACSLCPLGRFAAGGNRSCELCQEGSCAAPGSTQCSPCDAGLEAAPPTAAGSDTCAFDVLFAVLLAICCTSQFTAWFALVRNLRCCIRITDVFRRGDQVVLTTFQPHGVTVRCASSAKVRVAGTGVPQLDSAISGLEARVIDEMTLELLGLAKAPSSERLDSSMGTVALRFPSELLHCGQRLPIVALSAALLIVAPLLLAFAELVWKALRSSSRPPCGAALPAAAAAVAALLGAACALLARRRYARALAPMQQRRRQFREHLLRDRPHPAKCEPGPGRAVFAHQLTELLQQFRDFVRDRDCYYVNANITTLLTSHHKLSYAELAGPTRLQYFISHHWGGAFARLVEAVQHHAKFAGGADWGCVAYWACLLSVNQWDVASELGSGGPQASFFQALRSERCLGTCLVLDARALPLSRAWCLLEILETYRARIANPDFQGLFFCTEQGVLGAARGCYDTTVALGARLGSVAVAEAATSREEDQLMIAQNMADAGGAEAVEEFLRENLCAELRVAQKGLVAGARLLNPTRGQKDPTGAEQSNEAADLVEPEAEEVAVAVDEGGAAAVAALGRGAGRWQGGVLSQLQRALSACLPWGCAGPVLP